MIGKSRIRQAMPTAHCWRTKGFNFQNLESFRDHGSHGRDKAPARESSGGKGKVGTSPLL